MRFIKRDKPRYFGKTSQMAARPIKYDFTDPVLNREFLETVTHHNQVTFRMRNDPTYAKQVNAQLNLYNREKLMKLPEAAPPGTMFNRSRNSATAGHDWNNTTYGKNVILSTSKKIITWRIKMNPTIRTYDDLISEEAKLTIFNTSGSSTF